MSTFGPFLKASSPANRTEVSKVGSKPNVNWMALMFAYKNSPRVAQAFALR